MASKEIVVKGARENNLKNINISLPKEKLIVFTGVSGSGKSTLAFDTIYNEGQRRYVESLSSYARQFLGNVEKPDVDHVKQMLIFVGYGGTHGPERFQVFRTPLVGMFFQQIIRDLRRLDNAQSRPEFTA